MLNLFVFPNSYDIKGEYEEKKIVYRFQKQNTFRREQRLRDASLNMCI